MCIANILRLWFHPVDKITVSSANVAISTTMLKCFDFSYKRHFTFILVIFMSIKCLYTAINIVNPALNICQGEKPMWRILPSWNVHLSRVLRHYRIADIIIQFVHCVRSFPLYTFETKGNKTCKEERKDVIVANKNWIFASAAQLGKKRKCVHVYRTHTIQYKRSTRGGKKSRRLKLCRLIKCKKLSSILLFSGCLCVCMHI